MTESAVSRYDAYESLDPIEAIRLISQPGVRIEVGVTAGTFWDGDILMKFHLPAGEIVLYRAEHLSDYYGGHYDEIRWEIAR